MANSTLDKTTFTDSSLTGHEFEDAAWQSQNDSLDAGLTSSENLSETSTSYGGSIRKIEVADVTAQLAVMTRSGVDLASALASLVSQCQRPALAEVLEDVQEAVLSGHSFSEALKAHPKVFDPTFVATIAAGEASGKMSEVLQQLSSVQKKEIRRQREMRALLTYPVLLLAVSSSVLGALVVFVLPRFTSIFDQYNMPLPVITEFFLGVSAELHARWWLWAPLAVGSIVSLLIWRKSEHGRLLLDRFWLQGPLVGDICRSMFIGGTCRMLGLMLENGVTLLEGLRLTRKAISNALYKKLLDDLEEAVVNGQGLASVLYHSDVVPPSAKEMIITAESTGNLNEVMGILGKYYEEESEAKLRQLVGVLEPLITVVMGGIVAVVVLAVMLPVFDLSTFAAGGQR